MSNNSEAPPTKRSRVVHASTGDGTSSDDDPYWSDSDVDISLDDTGNGAQSSSQTIDVQFEAFGSGVVLSQCNRIPLNAVTVKQLRRFVRKRVCGPPTRSVRLFVGHGGAELIHGRRLLADTPLAEDLGKPIVVFRKLCTLPLRVPLLMLYAMLLELDRRCTFLLLGCWLACIVVAGRDEDVLVKFQLCDKEHAASLLGDDGRVQSLDLHDVALSGSLLR